MNIGSSYFKHYFNLFEKKVGKDAISNSSLYKLCSDFELFLQNETDIDMDELTVDIEELLKDDIIEILNSRNEDIEDEQKDTDTDDDGEVENIEEYQSADKEKGFDFILGFLSELFQDDDFADNVDANPDGKMDKDEYSDFFNALNSDEDSNLSLREIFKGIDKIKQDKFLLSDEAEDTDKTNDSDKTDDIANDDMQVRDTAVDNTQTRDIPANNTTITNDAAAHDTKTNDTASRDAVVDNKNNSSSGGSAVASSSPSGASGSSSGAAGGSSSATGSNTYSNPTVKPTTSDSSSNSEDLKDITASLEELKTQKTEKQTELNKYNTELQNVYNGSNEAVNTAKTEADDKKSDYDKAVENDKLISEELKKQKTQNDSDIAKTEETISTLNTSIIDKTTQIAALDSSIAMNKATAQGLENAKNSWSFRLGLDNTQLQSEAKDKIAQIQGQIDELNKQIVQDETKREELNGELDKDKAELQTAQNETLVQYLKEKEQIEQQILNNCGKDVKDKLKLYNDAEKALSSTIESEKAKAADNVEKAKNEVNELEGLIEAKTKEESKLKNKADSRVFVPAANGTLAYEILMPKDYDPNKEYNLYNFLPGDVQRQQSYDQLVNSTNNSALYKDTNPIQVISNWNLEGLEDTIAVTYFTGGRNYADCTKAFKNTVDAIKSGFNTNKSVLAGASSGAAGVSWMIASGMGKDYFDQIDYVAGDPNGTSLFEKVLKVYDRSEIHAHIGLRDGSAPKKKLVESYGFLPENCIEYEDTTHSQIVINMLRTDNKDASGQDKPDGISDYFEAIFNYEKNK